MSYEWAKIPVDLPKKNLVLITAKTTSPTIHRGFSKPEFKVRMFSPTELADSGASLRRRPIGLNHSNLIDTAFTVDAQFNQKTQCLEALCYFPTAYIEIMRREVNEGRRVEFSVEYFFRDAKLTESGAELIGICFDRVDLLLGMNGGDPNTSLKFVESADQANRDSIGAELDPKSLINGEIMSEDLKLKESEELKEKTSMVKALSTTVETLTAQREAALQEAREAIAKVKIAEDAKIVAEKSLSTVALKLTESEDKYKGLDVIATKAQENIKKFDAEKQKAVEDAAIKAKKEFAEKIKVVLPENTFVKGPDRGAGILAKKVLDTIKAEVEV